LTNAVAIKGIPGQNKDFCWGLRELTNRLLMSHQIVPPEGTRMMHVKTNSSKSVSLSCMIIFQRDLTYERPITRTEEATPDPDWATD
jgi:hypothetical protein